MSTLYIVAITGGPIGGYIGSIFTTALAANTEVTAKNLLLDGQTYSSQTYDSTLIDKNGITVCPNVYYTQVNMTTGATTNTASATNKLGPGNNKPLITKNSPISGTDTIQSSISQADASGTAVNHFKGLI